MKHCSFLLLLVMLFGASQVDAAERVDFTVADNSFKYTGTGNKVDVQNNTFTIGQSFGTVYWSYNKSIADYQYLVLRVSNVKGNGVKMILRDRAGVEYDCKPELAKIDGRQEIIVDLMRPLINGDGKTLNLRAMSMIKFWNYWDDGDGEPSATVTIEEMYLQPYGTTDVHIGNPVVQTCYTSDPGPVVFGDEVYLYTGHDADGATYYTMNDWKVYSTKDMVNWTDHGAPLSYKTFKWAKGDAWASQCIERNGKYYWYVCCTNSSTGAAAVGVAVGDSPVGPFKDAIGKPLCTGGWGYIDPTVYIDNNGQAYLYFGNPGLYYVRLRSSMTSYAGSIVEINQTEESFGGPKDNASHEDIVSGKYKDLYEEAPWFYRRGDIYYMVYAAGGVPEHIAYSTSSRPVGPWHYQGTIMPTQGGSFTNHPGIIEFKGNHYLFYHNGALPGGGGFTRSVAVEQFEYNDDGSIPQMNMTCSGVKPVATLNPFERTEAETIAFSYGVNTNEEEGVGVYLDSLDRYDYFTVREVDFGTVGAKAMSAVLRGVKGGTMKVYVDNPKGTPVATFDVAAETEWMTDSVDLDTTVTGKHDLYFVITGVRKNQMQIDAWQFYDTPASSIRNVNAALTDDRKCYDVDGRLATPTKRGIVIRGGKKYFQR